MKPKHKPCFPLLFSSPGTHFDQQKQLKRSDIEPGQLLQLRQGQGHDLSTRDSFQLVDLGLPQVWIRGLNEVS